MLDSLFSKSKYTNIPGATRKESRRFHKWNRQRGAGFTTNHNKIKDVEYSDETIAKMIGYAFPVRNYDKNEKDDH